MGNLANSFKMPACHGKVLAPAPLWRVAGCASIDESSNSGRDAYLLVASLRPRIDRRLARPDAADDEAILHNKPGSLLGGQTQIRTRKDNVLALVEIDPFAEEATSPVLTPPSSARRKQGEAVVRCSRVARQNPSHGSSWSSWRSRRGRDERSSTSVRAEAEALRERRTPPKRLDANEVISNRVVGAMIRRLSA